MKENNIILEKTIENINQELNVMKQKNSNLNETINKMKLNFDIEIAKYQQKIDEYEKKEISSNNNYEE